jgi:hypothetical protein
MTDTTSGAGTAYHSGTRVPFCLITYFHDFSSVSATIYG